ncbi:MAG: sulfatase-like hydrolase/transferase [Candidatus Hydrogenedentes bacterium]|nr:sulfatase-like hydrolase/transferase [Candidatus Hydrogenedentota bacterium]
MVILLADDMGYSDIGCYGGEIETPHIDALAAGGIRFTQFYNAARCCPTRACLLTGLYPHQAGMGGMVSKGSEGPEGPYQGYLNRRCVTLAEVLKGPGYRTYMSGKWHVGEAPAHWPCKRGFDRYFGLISGASSYYAKDEGRAMALDDAPFTPPADGFYMTDAIGDHAVQCIEEHDASAPFFQYVAFTAPHWPLHAPEETVAKYAGQYGQGWDVLRQERHARMLEMGLVRPEWPLSPRDDEVPAWEDRDPALDWERRMRVYAAMVDRMDQNIGRIVAALKAKGVFENTLILFLSDNGGCHENIDGRKRNQPGSLAGTRESYVAYERSWANASNTPYRLFKHWAHEGGAATPCIAHWPAGIAHPGRLTDQVGHILDFMPTVCALAGAAYPEARDGEAIQAMEGTSLLPVFRGEAGQAARTLCWEHMGNAAIRQGDWKLVKRTERESWELYDMKADRTELNEVSAAHPEIAAELKAAYDVWSARVGVKTPRKREPV